MDTYHVYILYSKKLQQYYVGQTEDIEQRLIRHNSGHGKHTKKGVPWILVWLYNWNDQLKSGGHGVVSKNYILLTQYFSKSMALAPGRNF